MFLFFIFSLAVFFWYEFIHLNSIFPSDFDESNLFSGVKSFYETNNLKSFNAINEDRSLIGEYNWYGPLITLLYGLIIKIVGFDNSVFIYINLIFLVLSLFFSSFLFNVKDHKRHFLIIFLSSYIFSFVFVYFPENLIVLFSIILLNSYVRIKCVKTLFLFTLLILFFSCFRLSIVFWSVSVLFLPKNLIKTRLKIFLLFLIFCIIIIYMKFFTAPSSILGFGDLHNGEGIDLTTSIRHIIKNSIVNLYRLFDRPNTSIVFFLFSLIILSFNYVINYKNINTLHVGLYVVVIVAFFAFVILYSTYWYFFEKQIAFVLPLIFYLIVKDFNVKDKRLYIFICLVLFLPVTITKTRQNIIDKKNAYLENMNQLNEVKGIVSFDKHLKRNGKNEVNILFKRDDYDVEKSRLISLFPLSFNGVPILYTSNISSSKNNEDIFRIHNKIRVDYILSSSKLKLDDIKKVYSNDQVFLYKIDRNGKK